MDLLGEQVATAERNLRDVLAALEIPEAHVTPILAAASAWAKAIAIERTARITRGEIRDAVR